MVGHRENTFLIVASFRRAWVCRRAREAALLPRLNLSYSARLRLVITALGTNEVLGFDRRHTRIELNIIGPAISTRVNAPVTVRAKCDHMCRMIGAAVA